VLEAAEGTGTREIARWLDTTPTTVSLWRGRFARQRLDGLDELPRCGAPPVYGEATDKRIRAVLDQPPPAGFARWNGPLVAQALGDVDVQYVWRSLRKQKIDLGGRKSWCESVMSKTCLRHRTPSSPPRPRKWSACTWPRPTTRLCSASMRSPRFRPWSALKAT
jgi:transposase